jgi:hypothetical protein
MSCSWAPSPSFVERLAPLRGSAGDVGLTAAPPLLLSPRSGATPCARRACLGFGPNSDFPYAADMFGPPMPAQVCSLMGRYCERALEVARLSLCCHGLTN